MDRGIRLVERDSGSILAHKSKMRSKWSRFRKGYREIMVSMFLNDQLILIEVSFT